MDIFNVRNGAFLSILKQSIRCPDSNVGRIHLIFFYPSKMAIEPCGFSTALLKPFQDSSLEELKTSVLHNLDVGPLI
jgi:hypothetical protein